MYGVSTKRRLLSLTWRPEQKHAPLQISRKVNGLLLLWLNSFWLRIKEVNCSSRLTRLALYVITRLHLAYGYLTLFSKGDIHISQMQVCWKSCYKMNVSSLFSRDTTLPIAWSAVGPFLIKLPQLLWSKRMKSTFCFSICHCLFLLLLNQRATKQL